MAKTPIVDDDALLGRVLKPINHLGHITSRVGTRFSHGKYPDCDKTHIELQLNAMELAAPIQEENR